LSIGEALAGLEDQARGKFKQVVHHLLAVVTAGRPLSVGLAKYPQYFSGVYASLVKIGESSGTLEKNLEYLTVQLEKEHDLRGKIKAAMFYPIFILTATMSLGLALAIFVLPRITSLFTSFDVELPFLTRVLLAMANFFQAHGLVFTIGLIATIVFLTWLLRKDFIKPFTHPIILRLPIIGNLSRQINLARFSRTMGTLLKSGMAIDQSLEITAQATENRVYRNITRRLIKEVKKGNTISSSLSNGKLFPKITVQMMRVGEGTGSLDITYFYLADYYETELDNSAKNMATILEPILLIVIGVVVGAMALAIITPIYKITSELGRS